MVNSNYVLTIDKSLQTLRFNTNTTTFDSIDLLKIMICYIWLFCYTTKVELNLLTILSIWLIITLISHQRRNTSIISRHFIVTSVLFRIGDLGHTVQVSSEQSAAFKSYNKGIYFLCI